MAGQVEGELSSEAVAAALSKQFNTLSTDCKDASNIAITCYTTDVPYQTVTAGNLEELLSLFRNFGSRAVNSGISIEVFSFLLALSYLSRALINQLSQSVNRLVTIGFLCPVGKKQ